MAEEALKIAILGSGSWGATLACLFAAAGHRPTLWTQRAEKATAINERHHIKHPVSLDFPRAVCATLSLSEALSGAEIVVFTCPSQALRSLGESARQALPASARPIILSGVKGLELSTHLRMSEVLGQVLPGYDIAALSGPNLASEIIAGMPAAAVIGCVDLQVANRLQSALSVPRFRLYSNADIKGVELGGTLKNVIAIAAGASDGLKLGANAKAALLTRGLAEMTRLSVKLGAQPLTLAGLAGMGDLLTTCAGPASRNYKLGMELAKGRKTEDILKDMGVAVEGAPTAEAVCELSIKLGVQLPIAEQVEATLKGQTSPGEAIRSLMSRPLSSEY